MPAVTLLIPSCIHSKIQPLVTPQALTFCSTSGFFIAYFLLQRVILLIIKAQELGAFLQISLCQSERFQLPKLFLIGIIQVFEEGFPQCFGIAGQFGSRLFHGHRSF